MGIPCQLTLKTTEQGIRLFANPVEEVALLRGGSHSRVTATGASGSRFGTGVSVGELYDLRLIADFESSGELKLQLPGAIVGYDVARKVLTCNGVSAPMEPFAGRIKLRLLVDRGSIEVFGNDGIVAISRALTEHPNSVETVKVTLDGEGKRSVIIEGDSLRSSW